AGVCSAATVTLAAALDASARLCLRQRNAERLLVDLRADVALEDAARGPIVTFAALQQATAAVGDGTTVFAQLLAGLGLTTIRRIVVFAQDVASALAWSTARLVVVRSAVVPVVFGVVVAGSVAVVGYR